MRGLHHELLNAHHTTVNLALPHHLQLPLGLDLIYNIHELLELLELDALFWVFDVAFHDGFYSSGCQIRTETATQQSKVIRNQNWIVIA